MRRLAALLLAAALLDLAACSQGHVEPPPPAPAEHAVGVHGMLVVGEARIYMSHLPLFHMPHAYQVILAVELSSDARATYQEDRTASGEGVYTFVPERFDLTEVQGKRRSLRGDLYRGHFERGGQPIATGIDVEISRVVLFRRLDPAASRPAMPTYVAFGGEAETFLAHWISAPPDFDQIVRVERTPGSDLAEGAVVMMQERAVDRTLSAGESLALRGERGKGPVRVTAVVYTETGDLQR